jgi:hypothetical protein
MDLDEPADRESIDPGPRETPSGKVRVPVSPKPPPPPTPEVTPIPTGVACDCGGTFYTQADGEHVCDRCGGYAVWGSDQPITDVLQEIVGDLSVGANRRARTPGVLVVDDELTDEQVRELRAAWGKANVALAWTMLDAVKREALCSTSMVVDGNTVVTVVLEGTDPRGS